MTKKELYEEFLKFCQDKKLPGMAIKAFGHKIKRAYNLAEERDDWRGIGMKKTNDKIAASKGE